MTDNIVPLNHRIVSAHERVERTPNQLTIDKLEALLVEARAGNIVGIAYAAYHAPNDVDQQISYDYCGLMRVVSVLGGLDMLKHDMIEDERREGDTG